MSVIGDVLDWFSKAKQAKKDAQDPDNKKTAKNEYGNQGAGTGAYADAKDVLDNLQPGE